MSVSGDDFLNSAHEFLDQKREIDYRNFISRGYYGMFHKILSVLNYMPNVSGSHHSALIDYLRNSSQHKNEPYDSMKLKSLGYIMFQERLSRNKADYELDCEEFNEDLVELSKKTHKKFNKTIEQLQKCCH